MGKKKKKKPKRKKEHAADSHYYLNKQKQDMVTNIPEQVEKEEEPKTESKELSKDEKELLEELEKETGYHSKRMNDVCASLKVNWHNVIRMSKSINEKLGDEKMKINTFLYFGSWYIGLQKHWDAAGF